jgi:hypothetical protein
MGMIINPYRFTSAWTPPNAVLWYYGSLLSGSQWADRIGSNHGTFQGGASAASDGVACSDTKYVTAASAGIETLFAGGDVMSAALWVKITDDNVQKDIILKDSYYTVNEWSAIVIRTNVAIHRLQSTMGQSIAKVAENNFTDGVWTHIAMVYDKTNSVYRFYVNTSLKHTSITGSYVTIPTNAANMIVGKACDYIDDVILSTTAWSNDDVADIYNNSPATHKP